MFRPYDPSRAALYRPADGVTFFPEGRPGREDLLAAEMARLAYVPYETLEGARIATAALAPIGFDVFQPFNAAETDSQAFLAADRNTGLAVLAFRGTQSDRWRDLRADLLAWPETWPGGGRVHHGFAAAFRDIWPRVASALQPRPRRLIFTGHSLGAALATLAASQSPPDALYTFGSPRVGDPSFAATLAAVPVMRFVDCADVVTRVPPAGWGYSHLGTLRYFDRTGRERRGVGVPAQWLDRLLGDLAYAVRWAWRPGTVWLRSLSDHAPANYIAAVAANPPVT